MNATESHTIKIFRTDLIDVLINNEIAKDETEHWCAVRISPDGSMHCSQEASPCYGEAEYYKRMPHTVTVAAGRGHGQCVLPDGWCDEDGYVQDMIPGIIEELENCGYEVELI